MLLYGLTLIVVVALVGCLIVIWMNGDNDDD
jgi:hypothetical protein